MTRSANPAIPVALTSATLVAFAANSVLCRLALGSEAIDPWAFTAVRLGSGALTLLLLTRLRRRRAAASGGSWKGALFLVLYALPFSLAYVRLTTGTGALLLFGAVQLTMLSLGIRAGERPGRLEWIAIVSAAAGVVYLVSPGLTAPDPLGAAFMAAAGIGWGLYSIAGMGAGDPASVTAGNFLRAGLLVVPATALAWPWLRLTVEGTLLAVASGAVASGLGYAVWYSALRYLTATRAALVQLAVPVLAAAGGVVFVSEPVTPRLVVAGIVILGAIALGTAGRARRRG